MGKHIPYGIGIVHEDRDIIVIDKPAGLLTMASETERERTAYFMLTDYVRKSGAHPHDRVFIVHRLDRDTSGLVVFARTERAKHILQEGWGTTEKRYLAVVHGHLVKKSGIIESYLAENKARVVYTTRNKKIGKFARTAFTVVRESPGYSLLEINLLTGRKNQIRVHLADEKHPVVGDRKYGRTDHAYKRLLLHAASLTFTHPRTGERISFTSPVPAVFSSLV